MVTYKWKDSNQYLLPPRFSEVNHSPDGFNWGYGGSGPSQLAYAILRQFFTKDFTDEQSQILTQRLYHRFKDDMISRLTADTWTITECDLLDWIRAVRDEFLEILEFLGITLPERIDYYFGGHF